MQLPDGSLLPAPYIQGVATAAEKQRRGYCRRLLAAAEQDLAARGYPLCILKPFNPDFYQPLGYRFFSYIRRYNLRLDKHFLAGAALPSGAFSVPGKRRRAGRPNLSGMVPAGCCARFCPAQPGRFPAAFMRPPAR